VHNLLLHLSGNLTLNRTLFPPHLYVYDDILVYKRRSFLKSKEITVAYSHITQVMLLKGIFFAGLDVITAGIEHINIRFVNKMLAEKAKKIIDQKIYTAHAKHKTPESEGKNPLGTLEKSIARYKELLEKGVITQKQFDQKTTEVLKGF
jgi:hypothetical protein